MGLSKSKVESFDSIRFADFCSMLSKVEKESSRLRKTEIVTE